MPRRRKRYESIEEEDQDRGIPVWLIQHERRVNEALNQPEFLELVNEALFGQEPTTSASPQTEAPSKEFTPQPRSNAPSRRSRTRRG